MSNKILTRSNQLLLTNYIRRWKVSEFESVLETRLLSEYELAEILSKASKFPRVYNVQEMRINKSLYEGISYDFLINNLVTPISKLTIGAKVAIANPFDDKAIEEIQSFFPKRVKFVVAEVSDIKVALHRNYPIENRILKC